MKNFLNIEKFGEFCRLSVEKAWDKLWEVKPVSKSSKFIQNLIFLQFYKKQLLKAGFEFSFLSLPVIFLTALCTGAVLTLQTFAGLGFFASPNSVARVIVPAIIRELGPVLTGLMIAGRISSSIAAQIATMKTTDQINALKTLSIDPVKYLVLPRVFTGMILMPLLMLIANIIAFLGSFLIMIFKFHTTPTIFIESLIEFFILKDLNVGLVKALFFGFIITVVGSLKGLNSKGNSEGVGVATTEAVVTASILILFVNYILTLIFF
jgi:phospholipid/cholesterol/gamma-HCH transport system permease protein